MCFDRNRSGTPTSGECTFGRLLERTGPLLAALLAACAALPALRMPFISDDWGHLAAVVEEIPNRTPMGYFRPLTLASFWLDLRAWGLSSSLSHLTSLILISSAAALVVILIRRYTGDGILAASAGALFALHPFHVENAAWIAARADLLFSLFFLGAALAYERWRNRLRGVPIIALLFFEAALLAKETAIVFPLFLLTIALVDEGRRPTAMEWARGYLPVVLVALAHFALLRPLALGELGLGLLSGFGLPWVKRLIAFVVAAILPLHIEVLEGQPLLWSAIALSLTGVVSISILARARRIPPIAWAAALSFVVLLGPSLISFQERYLFLPSAASAVALASLLRSAGRRVRMVTVVLLASGWIVSSGDHWIAWREAGLASTRLIDDLVEASIHPEVEEIIVANMPHRIRGAPVAADFSSAVSLSGGRMVTVRPAAYIDYPTSRSDALASMPGIDLDGPRPHAEVRLRIVEERYSRYVWPLPPGDGEIVETEFATVSFREGGMVRVRIPTAPERGRAAYIWSQGRLEPLF